ncbi:MAG: mRNA surveillance protein pelota [Thermoplasmatota archaeon]
MRILERNDDRKQFKVRIDSLDDLWYLHQALSKGTIAGSYTYRKLEAKEDQIRADAQPRIRVYLRISVEGCEFHPFTDVLRVKGEVLEGPHEISGHHTFNVDVGTVLDLDLAEDDHEAVSMLEEAEKGELGTLALAVSIDDETADLFRLRDYGMERIGTVRAAGGGKWAGKGGGWEGYYRETADLVSQNIGEEHILIVAGPGFFKESLAKVLREDGVVDHSRIHVLHSSSGGAAGLREALTRGESLGSALKDLRFVRENELLEELMARIGRGKGAAYGSNEVRKALSMGAVEVLLISERLFREGTGRELMGAASETGARTMITSVSHELGEMLDRIGGAGALLRFEI